MKQEEYDLRKKLIEEEHALKLKCLEYKRKTEVLKHDYNMQQIRLRSANMRQLEELKRASRSSR